MLLLLSLMNLEKSMLVYYQQTFTCANVLAAPYHKILLVVPSILAIDAD